jgi:uncharacterized protein YqhQ
MPDKFPYGGQAVIEGVMIRGRGHVAVACRIPSGDIKLHTEPIRPLTSRSRFLSLPFVRGTPALLDALRLGFSSLLYSANVALQAEGQKPLSKRAYGVTIAASLVFAVIVFVLLPSLLVPRMNAGVFLPNLAEGLIRNAVFVIYILIIFRLPQIRKLFQYHGAEHKVVNAFEAEADLSEAGRFSTIHPRCGTDFIAMVVVVGILVHFLIGWPSWPVRLATRILAIPVIAGISYEILRLAGRRPHSRLLRALVSPGLWLQRLTTAQPDDRQVEVAKAALTSILDLEQREAAEAPSHA